MKRVLISDLHLHPFAYGGTVLEGGWNARLWGQKLALDEVIDYVQEHGVEYLYFNGDLFHTPGNVPTQALEVAREFFWDLRRLGCDYRLLVGNHDMANKSGTINGLGFLDDGTNVARPGESRTWYDGGVKVMGLGYTEDEGTIMKFLEDAGRGGDRTVLLLHQGVAGVPLASGYVIDERLTPEMIPDNCFAFTGHYHFHRVVTPNLIVVGNLTPLGWSDIDQEKGFVAWDDETGAIDFIPQTLAPKFLSFSPEWSVDEAPVEIEGNFIRYAEEVDPKEIASIRQRLMDEGARGVEFPHVRASDNTVYSVGYSFDFDKLVDAVVDKDMEPRRKEVGDEVREAKYSVPA